MSHRRNGLRKQVTEEPEGPLEVMRKREARKMLLEEGAGERYRCAPWRLLHWVLNLEGICLDVSEEDPNRIFIIFPGVSFQSLGLH